MKFLHMSDIHLGASPEIGRDGTIDRAGELWTCFKEAMQAAKAEQVDFVLISGDLFHRQPLLRELKEVNYICAGISPIRVVICAGNHDYLKADSKYRSFQWSKNVAFFGSEQIQCLYFEQQQTYIYGHSYEHMEIERPLYGDVSPLKKPGIHILMAHGGDSKHIPIQYRALQDAGFDYVAMGHIHKPEIMFDGRMAYAGALQPIDRNDVGLHGYILGSIDAHGTAVRFVPVEGRSYIHLTIEVDGRMPWGMIVDFVADEIAAHGQQHMYKIILKGETDPEMEKDYEDLWRLGQIVDIDDRTVDDLDIDALYEANRDNIIGRYIERVRLLQADETAKEKALTIGLRALLQ